MSEPLVSLRLGYADPPYPGMAHRYDCEEIDYACLITKLINEYHGWALCLGANNLADILPMVPVKYRIGAWVKPFAFGKPGVNPIWSWEPVVFSPARKGRESPLCKDHLVQNVRGLSGKEKFFFGAKPREFNHWILDILGYKSGDDVDDLFPGTRGMSYAILEREKKTLPLELVG